MIVCLIAIAVMLLAISFLCGYLVGARDSADRLRVEVTFTNIVFGILVFLMVVALGIVLSR